MTTYFRRLICIPALLLIACAGNAAAGQLDLIVNGRSYHVNSEYDWNENNFGLGLEYQFDTSSRWIWSVNGNAFIDSLENPSYMVGGGVKRRLFQSEHPAGFYIDAGLSGFIMARADFKDYTPFPGVLPVVTLGMKNFGMNITYLPKKIVHDIARANVVDPTIGGVFFLQFKFRLPDMSQ